MPKKRSSKSSPKSKKSKSIWKDYTKQRDEFYASHQYIRPLLGVLIVSFAIAIGVLYYNKTVVYIGLSLDDYGVNYPYLNVAPVVQNQANKH